MASSISLLSWSAGRTRAYLRKSGGAAPARGGARLVERAEGGSEGGARELSARRASTSSPPGGVQVVLGGSFAQRGGRGGCARGLAFASTEAEGLAGGAPTAQTKHKKSLVQEPSTRGDNLDRSYKKWSNYEFTEKENSVFVELCQVLTRLSLVSLIAGACNLVTALITFATSNTVRHFHSLKVEEILGSELWRLVNGLVAPLAMIYGAYVLFTVSKSFSLIVTTEGKDIEHLLMGVQQLRNVLDDQWKPLLGTALCASVTLLGTLNSVAILPAWASKPLPLLTKGVTWLTEHYQDTLLAIIF